MVFIEFTIPGTAEHIPLYNSIKIQLGVGI